MVNDCDSGSMFADISVGVPNAVFALTVTTGAVAKLSWSKIAFCRSKIWMSSIARPPNSAPGSLFNTHLKVILLTTGNGILATVQ
ncbi:hypothetical protein D3C80_1283570 [compost metagenome]